LTRVNNYLSIIFTHVSFVKVYTSDEKTERSTISLYKQCDHLKYHRENDVVSITCKQIKRSYVRCDLLTQYCTSLVKLRRYNIIWQHKLW